VLIVCIAFIFGTFIGSFLNVCVHRLPRNESIVTPPSRCYACGTHLTWYDNLPVLGWLLVWGRCRWCGTAFSPRYLFAELGVGALTAATTWWVLLGASARPDDFAGQVVPLMTSLGVLQAHTPWAIFGWGAVAAQLAALLVLVWTLYVSSLIDLDHLLIPDEITKSLQVVAPFLAVAAATGWAIEEPLPYGWLVHGIFDVKSYDPQQLLLWMGAISGGVVVLLLASVPLARWIYSSFTSEAPWSEEDHRGFRIGVWWFCACTAIHMLALTALLLLQPGTWWMLAAVPLAQAILGSLAGWCSLYVVGFLGTIAFRRNAMGFGDVKFLAPIGAFLGPLGVVYAFFAAAIVGTCVGVPQRLLKSMREVPFGPYLAVGALIVLVAGGRFHHWLFPAP
jgi:prepilin signal peptidase PulO-like enzyme (type II secretory pathway)